MKKNFKYYVICWFVLLAVFNAICFVTPNLFTIADKEFDKFGGAFWAGYIGITIAFIGQLVCAYIALKTDDKTKLFYNIPIIRVSYTGLIITLVFGALCMAIPNVPNWVGIVICAIILLFNIIALVKAKAAAEIVSGVDEKVKEKTFFIKSLTVDADSLLARATSDAAKTACKKVFDAVRYSDPMSNDALADIESRITEKFNELTNAVAGGADNIETIADELVVLVGDRNRKCKLLK